MIWLVHKTRRGRRHGRSRTGPVGRFPGVVQRAAIRVCASFEAIDLVNNQEHREKGVTGSPWTSLNIFDADDPFLSAGLALIRLGLSGTKRCVALVKYRLFDCARRLLNPLRLRG